MPFVLNDWGVAVEGYGRSIWRYEHATDNMAAITASGYFNPVASNLTAGDIIVIQASDTSGLRRVTSAKGVTPVTVAALG